MGSIFSARAADENEISLSERCIERLVDERTALEREVYSYVPVSEEKWMRKLKCMDELHSDIYGITPKYVYALITKLEGKARMSPRYCSSDDLKECLLYNKRMPMNCKKMFDKFFNCIDVNRIEIIKEKKAMRDIELRKKKREEQKKEAAIKEEEIRLREIFT